MEIQVPHMKLTGCLLQVHSYFHVTFPPIVFLFVFLLFSLFSNWFLICIFAFPCKYVFSILPMTLIVRIKVRGEESLGSCKN